MGFLQMFRGNTSRIESRKLRSEVITEREGEGTSAETAAVRQHPASFQAVLARMELVQYCSTIAL